MAADVKPRARAPGSTGPKGLRVIRPFDPWASPLCTCPFKYSLNPYTGCSIGCLYCYATAYIGARPSTPKRNIIANILRDLRRLPYSAIINLGTSSDPYPPEEEKIGLTRRILEILIPSGRRVLITTKSSLVARDAQLLASGNAAVTPTITMLDPGWASIVEPNAPSPQDRIKAVEKLVGEGVPVGVRVDPIIPYINDDPDEIRELVCRVAEAGARFVVTSTYKARPDNLARMARIEVDGVGEKIYKLYRRDGIRVGGYIYLPRSLRERLLRPVVEAARHCGLEYATCREGLPGREWFNAGSCDGSHLIPNRITVRTASRLDRWMKGE